ncbi:MAG: DNA primase [Muribaculaceae bacterium]|nr:DNA primase [Muribaculaceae bacterium]
MPLIDKETVQAITDRADIVEVVGDYVHLIRRGANYMGLCPFHNERTPSFSVNKRKNFCYCFSCKQGGSPVNFIMKKEGLSYHEALLHLARKYGIEVRQREQTPDELRRQTEREAMFVANEWAMKRMQENLFNTEEGKNVGLSYFFGQRGITQKAAEAFRLGYAIDSSSSLTSEAKAAGLQVQILQKLGLVGISRDGRNYDKYRGRVIFPIINRAGKVIGFGGRTLKNDIAKYINSPESEIYKKSQELYGIYQARNAIAREDKCYLVEGYFDVIGMWQSGLENVVASSGTALTEGQIVLIRRFTENVTLIYDGDPAGIKAALRGIDMLLHQNMKVKVLLLPDGEDPDSFARKNTPEQFRKYVDANETDVISFKARVLVNEVKNDPQQRINAVHEMVTTLAHISDQVSRNIYIQECSMVMNIPEETILNAVMKRQAELHEQWRKERTRKELDRFAPGNISVGTSSDAGMTEELYRQASSSPNGVQDNQKSTEIAPRSSYEIKGPLYDLEKRIMEYAVKYGYTLFCKVDTKSDDNSVMSDSDENTKWWNVVEFIDYDLKMDNIEFSLPLFEKIFNILLQLKPQYLKAKERKESQLYQMTGEKRKIGYEEIASKNLSMEEIRKEEKNLEREIKEFEEKEIADFQRNFPLRALSNHEDDQIREMITELGVERHQLSNIYYRDNNSVETEEDRLVMLLPRALNELKSKILDLQVKDLFRRFSEASKNQDHELETKLQMEINDKILLRAGMAKGLGERIVAPSGVNR